MHKRLNDFHTDAVSSAVPPHSRGELCSKATEATSSLNMRTPKFNRTGYVFCHSIGLVRLHSLQIEGNGQTGGIVARRDSSYRGQFVVGTSRPEGKVLDGVAEFWRSESYLAFGALV